MEKQYRLKTVQKNRSTDFLSVAASIYLGERHIGALHSCPDTGEIEFEFALPMDRLVFENFITHWWESADHSVYFGMTELAMIRAHSTFHPSLSIKMRCWVKSIIRSVPATAQVNELAAA